MAPFEEKEKNFIVIIYNYSVGKIKGAVALRCGSFVFLSNTKRRASKSPAFVV